MYIVFFIRISSESSIFTEGLVVSPTVRLSFPSYFARSLTKEVIPSSDLRSMVPSLALVSDLMAPYSSLADTPFSRYVYYNTFIYK